MEFPAGVLAAEPPVDAGMRGVYAMVPCARFADQGLKVGDASLSQALAGKEPNLDFGLVQPASVLLGVWWILNRSQISVPISLPKVSVNDFLRWMLRLSITRWMVLAVG
jgi:hypothetical protein